MTTAEYVPAAEVTPETFTVRAADHRQRGTLRGQELGAGIERARAGYRKFFAHLQIAEADVLSAADSSFAALQAWDAEAAEEIESVAAGAGISVTELMTVVARTEIMTQAPAGPTECSTVSFTRAGSSLAAQNWDWAADFSTLWHINDVGAVPGQLAHAGFAEYGMLGKIGLNEAGVGVLLNILKHVEDGPGGVPIHMVLERVLSRASTLDEALQIIHSAPTSSSSIITVVTADEVVQVEISNIGKRERRAGDAEAAASAAAAEVSAAGYLIHTNHFLHPDQLPGGLELRANSTSRVRYAYLEDKIAKRIAGAEAETTEAAPETTAELIELLNSGPGEAPVCCTPLPEEAYGERSATLVTVQIDPARKTIDLAPGSPADGLRDNRSFRF